MHVGVVSRGGHQTGLTQSLKRVAQLHQPTSQATARRVADPHVLDQFRRADSALVQDRQSPLRAGVTACDRNPQLRAIAAATRAIAAAKPEPAGNFTW